MAKARVILLSHGSVMAAGVLRLLQAAGDLEVVAVTIGDPDAERKVMQFAPDIIVLDCDDAEMEQRAVTLLLRHNPDAGVVLLNSSRSDAEVYRLERVAQPTIERLLDVIHRK